MSERSDTLIHYIIGGHLPVKRYTVVIMQNRGIQMDRGRRTRKPRSGNEQSESRLALKPQTNRESRGSKLARVS